MERATATLACVQGPAKTKLAQLASTYAGSRLTAKKKSYDSAKNRICQLDTVEQNRGRFRKLEASMALKQLDRHL